MDRVGTVKACQADFKMFRYVYRLELLNVLYKPRVLTILLFDVRVSAQEFIVSRFAQAEPSFRGGSPSSPIAMAPLTH